MTRPGRGGTEPATGVVPWRHERTAPPPHRQRPGHDERGGGGQGALRRPRARPGPEGRAGRGRRRGRAPRRRRCRRPAARVAAGRDPRRRVAAAQGAPGGLRAEHRGRGREADQDRADRGRTRGRDVRVRRGRGPHARRRDDRDGRATSPAIGKLGFTLRVPVGVVGAISPFNFPLNLVSHKVAPAIAAGLPGRAEARVADAAHLARCSPRSCSTSAASRRAGSTSSPAAAAPSATRSSTTPTSR